jgi:dihydroflavonol-4-reductase
VPGWMVKALAPVIPRMRELAPQVNVIRRASSAKARDVLGWQPRTPQDTVMASAESLVLLARSGPVG